MPANSIPHSGPTRTRRSINTAFQDSPLALQCTSDSAAAARVSRGGALPPLPPLSTLRNSNAHISSTFQSSLGPLPPLGSGYDRSSLNPSLQPNVRSGSWSQVENALPPLTLDGYQDPYPGLSRKSSHSTLSSIQEQYPTGSFNDQLHLPPMPPITRPSSPLRTIKRSSSVTSLSSTSDWNSSSKTTPSLSVDSSCSRRSASSDLDEQLGMPSTASLFGLDPSLPAASRSSVGTSRLHKPMFGYDSAIPAPSAYGMHAPNRTGSIDPLSGLDLSASTRFFSGFQQLSSETYPSTSVRTPGYSTTGSSGLLDGGSHRSSHGLYGSNNDPLALPGSTTRRGGLAPMPSLSSLGGSPSGYSAYPPLSPSGNDVLARGHGRRLSRNASYAGLSSFEASGW